MRDLHATALAVLQPSGHIPNRGKMLLHNMHFKYMYVCMSNAVRTKSIYFSSEGISERVWMLLFPTADAVCKWCPESHSSQPSRVLPWMWSNVERAGSVGNRPCYWTNGFMYWQQQQQNLVLLFPFSHPTDILLMKQWQDQNNLTETVTAQLLSCM